MIARLHHELVFKRRVKVLTERLTTVLPPNCSVLDVGCGDGSIDQLVMKKRPDIDIQGVDVFVRPGAKIPVRCYDGAVLPFENDSIDITLFVDVLHHTIDPYVLLCEAHRVSRRYVVIKDHLRNSFFAGSLLRFMDCAGNAPHGVALTYNYWPSQRWQETFSRLHWKPIVWLDRLGLYPWPGSLIFDRGLHFLAVLDVCKRPNELTISQ